MLSDPCRKSNNVNVKNNINIDLTLLDLNPTISTKNALYYNVEHFIENLTFYR